MPGAIVVAVGLEGVLGSDLPGAIAEHFVRGHGLRGGRRERQAQSLAVALADVERPRHLG